MVRAATPGPVSSSRPVIQEVSIYICKTEAGPTVQDTEIPAIHLRPGFSRGRQSKGSVTAWQRHDQGSTALATLLGWLVSGKGIARVCGASRTEGDRARLGVY